MASIQGNLLKLYFQFQRFNSPPQRELDLGKERAESNRYQKCSNHWLSLKILQ